MARIAIHSWLVRSLANGPGRRTVVWTQGCTLACPGCFNPHTHAAAPADRDVLGLVQDLLHADPAPDGLTVSGGEPLQQPHALPVLVDEWKRRTGTGVIIISGFGWSEIETDPQRATAVAGADAVIAGRYNQARHLGEGLRGSSNKQYRLLTDRYSIDDLNDTPEVELVVAPDGTVTVTGMASAQQTATDR